MSTIGARITPNTAASMRHATQPPRPERLPSDTMDAMAEGLGWGVVRDCDDRGYPRSAYRRGVWTMQVGWTQRGGHGVRASLTNEVSNEHHCPDRQRWLDENGDFNPFKRSQDIFRWVGHRLYDETLR